MADGLTWGNRIRSYEVSIWTLQDRFLSVLKWATMDCKGQIQEPEITLRDDGTQEFSFTIPKFYYAGANKIDNPMWLHLENQPLEANMHKLKVIFNKGTENEQVLEFLVVSVAHDHTGDKVDINVKAEGLAFHELGKIGYKIALSETNYTLALDEWELNGLQEEQPLNNIQFWNDLVFRDSDGNWRTNWTYELQMDWSAFSALYASDYKRSDTLYEDEYISSWYVNSNGNMAPREIQATREKCRIIDVSASNIYNITQTIAEQFGVFCRYEYIHDENYQIVGRKVIYYNNYIQDQYGHIDLTYPYSSAAITRTVDNSNVVTKMFVSGVDYDSDTVTIMDVDANKTKEDYLLDFDYLHDIQAITDEQYEAIKEFEVEMHKLNNSLIQVQERIRVVQNQLTSAEADATLFRNASALDAERWEAAGKLRAELTGGTNIIPLNGKPCTVLFKDECGYYINITIDGVDKDTIKLYQTSNFTGSADAYSDPITSFNTVDNEFHNLVRIDHITSSAKAIKEGDTIWLCGYYNPTLAYDNIQKVWAARKINDDTRATTAEQDVFDYNWYLHGRRVGYAQAGYSRIADDSGWPPAAVGPISINSPFVSDKVDQSRVVDKQIPISELTYNYFADLDEEIGTPDLLYYQDTYIENKEKLISKFERMMGPALREGYWQPENYHDYGDLFKDDLSISYREENIVQPSTSHLHFIWDGDKYYDGEEPLIYTADAAGNAEQHLAIDLSDCLDAIANNLDNLSLVYCNPSNVATLAQVRARQAKAINKLNEFNTITNDKISFFNTLDSVQNEFNNNLTNGEYSRVVTTTTTMVMHDHSDRKEWRTQITAALDNMNSVIDGISIEGQPIKDIQVNYSDNYNAVLAAWVSIQDILAKTIEIAEERKNDIVVIKDSSDSDATDRELLQNVLNTIDALLTGLKNLNSMLVSTINSTEDGDETVLGLIGLLQTIYTQNSWIESLENTQYSSFRIGSECELGWIAKKGPNDSIERKPVLIITGDKTLDDNTVDFIVSNYYTTSIIDIDQERIIQAKARASKESSSFIGVPVLDENGDTVLNKWKKIKIVGGVPGSFIGTTVESVEINNENVNKIAFNRKIPQADYDSIGRNRAPTPQEYEWVRQYPRLYFDTLKLKETEIKLFQDTYQLKEFEEYYTVEDDRSTGLKVKGVGYYTTIKPELFYKTVGPLDFSVVYTLSNVDVAIYLDALNVMYENARPKVSYEVELSVLNPEFVHTAYKRLNQIVHINDNDLKLENVSGYISTVTLKLDKPWEDTIEIKNYETKFEDLFSTIVAQTEAMKSSRPALNTAIAAFTSTGLIDKDVIYDSINSANLNLSFNSGKLTIDQAEGIWGTSDTGVVAFRGGGIFTATEKDNSGNWIWNTGILPSGINADLITTGQLDTNKIKVYAGNELRFQWNGEGLYAYKSFSSDLAEISNLTMNMPTNKIDQKQYVKFNQDGLFLTSEAGAYYRAPIATQVDGSTVYAYDILPNTIDRVEISWKGLTLRNWKNEDVFFANPDTGNLTLEGNIIAKSGTIGGWTITDEMLSGNGVNLVGTDSTESGAGIYLTNGVNAGESIIINGERCYHYTYIDENDIEQDCYCPLFNIATPTRVLNGGETIYTKQYVVISAVPKYLDIIKDTSGNTQESTTITNNEVNGDLLVEESIVVNNINTHIYIVKTEGSKVHIQDSNNQDIEYNGTTSPQAEWYIKIKAVDAQNYTTYIDENKVMAYVQTNLPAGTEITAVTDFKTTFSARASDGSVFIRKGQVGNYIIDTTNSGTTGILNNSQLNLDNYFVVDNKQIELGQIFYDITANSNAGTFSLYRLNGATENFNVAAMQAYKDAVAAAGSITLTLTYSNNVARAVATSGLGIVAIKELTIASNGGSATVNNSTPSQCNGCTSNCAQACANSCKSGCKGTCETSCGEDCTNTCGNDCNRTCDLICTTGCTTGCTGGCSSTCTGKCKGTCTANCSEDCTNSCGNTCNRSCDLVCTTGCTTGCKGTCKTTCTKTCGSSCGTSCTQGCAATCNNSCGGSCSNQAAARVGG